VTKKYLTLRDVKPGTLSEQTANANSLLSFGKYTPKRMRIERLIRVRLGSHEAVYQIQFVCGVDMHSLLFAIQTIIS